MMDLFLTNSSFALHKTDGLEWCGLLVDYCDVFFNQLFGLSFWRHPFTAEDPLVSKWKWHVAKYGDPYSEFVLCI